MAKEIGDKAHRRDHAEAEEAPSPAAERLGGPSWLTGQCHPNRYSQADSEASGETADQFQGNDADDGAHVPTGL
jgi:hypothetical protein